MAIPRCCPATKLYARDLDAEAGLFKALGDPARAAIVATLARSEREICVCDFTDGLGLSQPTVSHHLKVLRDAGLIASERRGTWVYYTLAPSARTRLERALDVALPAKVLA